MGVMGAAQTGRFAATGLKEQSRSGKPTEELGEVTVQYSGKRAAALPSSISISPTLTHFPRRHPMASFTREDSPERGQNGLDVCRLSSNWTPGREFAEPPAGRFLPLGFLQAIGADHFAI